MVERRSVRAGAGLAVALVVAGVALEALLRFERLVGFALVIVGAVLLVAVVALRVLPEDRRRSFVPIGAAAAALLLSTVLLYPSQNAYSSEDRFFAWNALGWALLPDARGIVIWAVVAFAGSAASWILLTRLIGRMGRRRATEQSATGRTVQPGMLSSRYVITVAATHAHSGSSDPRTSRRTTTDRPMT